MKTASITTATKAEMHNGDLLILPCVVNYYYLTTEEQAKEAVDLLTPIISHPESMIALDIETTGYDPYLHDIVLLQIGTKENIQYIFDLRTIKLDTLKPLFETDCWKVGHNIKFDAKFIKHKAKANIRRFFDTFLAERIIRGGSYGGEGYALDAIIKKRLSRELTIQTAGFTTRDGAVDRAKKTMQTSFLNLKNEEISPAQLAYAAQDVSAQTLFKIAAMQTKELKEFQTNILYDPAVEQVRNKEIIESYKASFPPQLRLWETALLEFKFLEVVIDLELTGIGFSLDTHREVMDNIAKDYQGYRVEFLKLLASCSGQQKTLFGTASVNPDSNLQVLEALNRMGLNLPDTSSDNLDMKLKELKKGSLEYKVVDSLLNYRVMSKLVQAFGDKLANHLHPVTKRIHFEVQQVLDTGRISNSNPNLQQIPKNIDWKLTGKAETDAVIKNRLGLRECFQASPGYRFIIYDYSQQELRVAAANSRDTNMLKAFLYGKELHSYSATLMYGVEYEEFVKKVKAKDPETLKKRSEAKVVSFGALYGSGPSNLSKKLHIPMDQAQDILTRFWEAYPNLNKSMKRYGDLSNRLGYSNTVLGRRRYYHDIIKKIKWVELDYNPDSIQAKVEEYGMKWFTEKYGKVTQDNLDQAKTALIKKFKGEIARQAGNHTIQGTSADMTKLAAIKIRSDFLKNKLDAKIVGLVHDEIIVEARVDLVEECDKIVEIRMKEALNTFCPSVPAEADGHVDIFWKKD